MTKKKDVVAIPDEAVVSKIFVIRGIKVMIDTDLAELYGVPTKRLNEQVRRNIKRFPKDFMFQLKKGEKQFLTKKLYTSEQVEILLKPPLRVY